MTDRSAATTDDAASVRVGVIGAGKRAATYFRTIPTDIADRVQVVAIADPDETRRTAFATLICPDTTPTHHTSGSDLLANHDLDAIIIGSPNDRHAEDTVLALAKHVPTLLEKPVAVSLQQARDIWNAHMSTGTDLIVGFVLRYSPFYTKVKEIIDSGALGEILAVDAVESLGTALTAAFHKGWRTRDDVSGGFLLEKCCHDFDVLNWLVGSRADRVFSMARRSHFRPRPESERHDARYLSVSQPEFDADYGDQAIKQALFTPAEGSPYDTVTTNPDHQVVMISYENDVLASLTVCMAQPRNTRRITVYGANGSLEGDLSENVLRIHTPHATGNGHDTTEIPVVTNTSGHHGADRFIGEVLWRAADHQRVESSRAGVREGIEAMILALAAQESAVTGSPVDLEPARDLVYANASLRDGQGERVDGE